MNVLGKILAFLVVIAAAVGAVFSAKLIQTRNSWTRKTQTFAKQYADARKQRDEGQRLVQQRVHDRDFLLREWGATAPSVTTQVSAPAEGKLSIEFGSNQGVRDQQLLYGFELKADGTSTYRGSFVVTSVAADRSTLTPSWRVRPDDVATWQPGRWRWRTMIPSGYSDRFADQAAAFTRGDELLADRQANLAIQQRLIAENQGKLNRRKAELVGGEDLPQDEGLSPEFRLGLVATLEQVEEERNGVLLQIDALRRQLRGARDAVNALQEGNLELVKKLPQPAAAISRND